MSASLDPMSVKPSRADHIGPNEQPSDTRSNGERNERACNKCERFRAVRSARKDIRVCAGLRPFRPAATEGCVLSLLAARVDGVWHAVAGSLLTTPVAAANTSWQHWAARQPTQSRDGHVADGFDLGPRFVAEPFPDVRVLRTPVDAAGWDSVVADLDGGTLHAMLGHYAISPTLFSTPALLGEGRETEPHRTVAGVSRPVRGVVATLTGPDMPTTDFTWTLLSPPYLRPGKALGDLTAHRRLLRWPRALLGIDWLASAECPPPRRFVVGRMQDDAWIVGMKPDYDAAQLRVTIAWNEQHIDLLSCVVGLHQEKDDMPLMTSTTRIADLPADSYDGPEPRTLPWDRRSMTVRLSRGLRRVDFGVTLRSKDGELLDERAVGPRVERSEFSISMAGASGPAHTSVAGDRNDPPTADEQQEALRQVRLMDEQARAEAARQRVSTTADVRKHLRWRFSCRAGELLILDPYLANDSNSDSNLAATLAYLSTFNRSIRALCVRPSTATLAALPTLPAGMQVRWLPTRKTVHDRYWVVGETGLHVGASLNGFAADSKIGSGPMFSITEMPAPDVVAHRAQFEAWWTAAGTTNAWTPCAP